MVCCVLFCHLFVFCLSFDYLSGLLMSSSFLLVYEYFDYLVLKPISSITVQVFTYTIDQPIRYLYRHGPDVSLFSIGNGAAVAHFGFWKGAADADICSKLTGGVPADHWVSHRSECTAIIERQYQSFLTAIIVLFYMILIYKFLNRLIYGIAANIVDTIFLKLGRPREYQNIKI